MVGCLREKRGEISVTVKSHLNRSNGTYRHHCRGHPVRHPRRHDGRRRSTRKRHAIGFRFGNLQATNKTTEQNRRRNQKGSNQNLPIAHRRERTRQKPSASCYETAATSKQRFNNPPTKRRWNQRQSFASNQSRPESKLAYFRSEDDDAALLFFPLSHTHTSAPPPLTLFCSFFPQRQQQQEKY